MVGNDDFERNLVFLEEMAYSKGLHPEAVSVMLEFAMSCRMGKKVLNSSFRLLGVLHQIPMVLVIVTSLHIH